MGWDDVMDDVMFGELATKKWKCSYSGKCKHESNFTCNALCESEMNLQKLRSALSKKVDEVNDTPSVKDLFVPGKAIEVIRKERDELQMQLEIAQKEIVALKQQIAELRDCRGIGRKLDL